MSIAAGRGGMVSLTGADPRSYACHALHSASRLYPETNCYSDVIIELLHAGGYEPLAAFGHLVRIDFEGDQWTFFKPPPEDLERLYGIDIHEMQPYRPVPQQIAEQIALGRTIIVELDAWFLPDTASTSYRAEHVKTSVAADAIDPEAEVLHYFHGGGLYALAAEDYRGVFRIGADPAGALPPYTEIVRFDAGERPAADDLRRIAHQTLSRHLARRPRTNPFARFGEALARELPTLLDADLAAYHAYAFATVRMAGAAFEVAADAIDPEAEVLHYFHGGGLYALAAE
ncbi:MAG TPA: DUF1839 family protein, partial [Solirubrobacteraceae bacterium]|nr:DUF1839 family protein [Solirubrobacteraceae bacterium]